MFSVVVSITLQDLFVGDSHLNGVELVSQKHVIDIQDQSYNYQFYILHFDIHSIHFTLTIVLILDACLDKFIVRDLDCN